MQQKNHWIFSPPLPITIFLPLIKKLNKIEVFNDCIQHKIVVCLIGQMTSFICQSFDGTYTYQLTERIVQAWKVRHVLTQKRHTCFYKFVNWSKFRLLQRGPGGRVSSSDAFQEMQSRCLWSTCACEGDLCTSCLESEGKGCDKLGTCCNFNSDPVVSFHSESHRDTHLGEEIPSQ